MLRREHLSPVVQSVVLDRQAAEYFLYSGEVCAGKLSSKVEEDDTIGLLGEGRLRVKSGGFEQQVFVSYDVSFNLLRQFVGGVVSVKSPLGEFRIVALKANPIQVSVQIARGNENLRFDQSIPGPLILVDTPSGGFTFRYDGPWQFHETHLTEQPLYQSLKLTVKKGAEWERNCAETEGALDLSQISALANSLSVKLNQYLPL